jgi:hypothetical protein
MDRHMALLTDGGKKMKKSCLSIFVTLAICSIIANLTYAQDYYQINHYRLLLSNTDVQLVNSLDIKKLGEKYLPEFHIQSTKNLRWETGVNYLFTRSNSSAVPIGINIGLYPSVREAEQAVLQGLNTYSVGMKEGPVQGESLGDNSWYAATKSALGEEFIINLTFIRYNAVISLVTISEGGINILSLAKSIDRDILSGGQYMMLEKNILPPVINFVDIFPKEIHEGDRIVMSVYASDSGGSSIKYNGMNLGHMSGDLENKLSIMANPVVFQNETFIGPHTFRLWVYNENNLFSSLKEFQITF